MRRRNGSVTKSVHGVSPQAGRNSVVVKIYGRGRSEPEVKRSEVRTVFLHLSLSVATGEASYIEIPMSIQSSRMLSIHLLFALSLPRISGNLSSSVWVTITCPQQGGTFHANIIPAWGIIHGATYFEDAGQRSPV